MNRRSAAIEALEQRLGHVFADRTLLEQALTHAGARDAAPSLAHNQVLEFLGDRVLGLVAADALMRLGPQWREGELTRRHAALVSGSRCADVARALGVGPALRLAGGDSKLGARENDRILGDAMEALMAAVYLDGGLDAARSLFDLAWKGALSESGEAPVLDPKTALNEWALARGLAAPRYETLSRSGSPHAPTFTVRVDVQGHAPETGVGLNVRSAQKAAADALLRREGAKA
ncbi:ribonuclease III [Phenylobacterium sp.]|uniref:ribonuclease III n=1 Tax=Phenylobacterium sp. TaxID=1871053 RepID=UPI002C0679AB|nr:ribonuclease III [Phenylobacterium sp.]HLZ77683.1 ribonuclease III [Phenylobacterium sp.]